MSNFDPNGVGKVNGNIFGFPVTEEDADIVIIPIPWDVTTSRESGCSRGPEGILEESTQLDFYHPELNEAWNQKIHMVSISKEWMDINDVLGAEISHYHDFLETDFDNMPSHFDALIQEVNSAQKALQQGLKNKVKEIILSNKIPGIVGGEHSVILGALKALSKRYKSFGVLQIDAHADLRKSYEGLKESHASVFYNSLKIKELSKIVQVGVRDVCQEEIERINSTKRLRTFFDWSIQEEKINGITWAEIVKRIIKTLPDYVYISFDIDGLEIHNCPNTGTPVPGGLSFSEARYLILELAKSKKKIIGFDLCEVSPNKSSVDASVGARILWELCCAIKINSQKAF